MGRWHLWPEFTKLLRIFADRLVRWTTSNPRGGALGLAIRLVLSLVAAGTSNGFVQFIDTVTNPFQAPFREIAGSPAAEGGYMLVIPIIIAIIVYALLHAAIKGLLRILVHRKTVI
ncbi:MAG: YggT family protein [Gemmatimonadales bacterium]|nr:MAG: YggT family protein [Gemmatimonadales bacterium]